MTVRKTKKPLVVLSIAGYDPSSGAGITADIKTIAAHGCYGVSCITALTVQSTRGVKRVDSVEGRIITETLEELMMDMEVAAVKIGMLGSAEAARAVSAFLKRHPLDHVVLDPILQSSSGAELLTKDALVILKERLLRQASVVTPNLAEAAALTSMHVANTDEMSAAALRLQHMGARNVIVTGGHLDPPVDVLSPEAGRGFTLLKGQKILGRSSHGTGCAFSTALACRLAAGRSLGEAAREAKRYVETALKRAPEIGQGIGPVV